LHLRGLALATQHAYLRSVEPLAVFTGKSPDLVRAEEFRSSFLRSIRNAAAPLHRNGR
jgi:hypothetical protein